MKKVLIIMLTLGCIFSCNTDESVTIDTQDFLIFGHFYAACSGETCVETFKLENGKLFEDTLSTYYYFDDNPSDDFFDFSSINFEFIELGNEQFEQVQDLENELPSELINGTQTIYGCPDCADGGGLLIQYMNGDSLRSWTIDQNKDNIPTFLHDFIDSINEKIAIINEQ